MSALGSLRRTALSRGVLGGSRVWLAVAVLVWALRGLQWAVRPTPTRVYRGRLEVGETIVIRHDPAPPTRRQRRRARRDEKEQQRRADRELRRSERRAAKAARGS